MPTRGNGINDCLFDGKEAKPTSRPGPGIERINRGQSHGVETVGEGGDERGETPTFVLLLIREIPGVAAPSADPGEGDEARLASSLLAVVPHPTRPTGRSAHPGEGNQRRVLRSSSLVRVHVGPCQGRTIIKQERFKVPYSSKGL